MTNCDKLESIRKRGNATKYSNAFKYASIELVLENPNKSIRELASEIGISSKTLWSWYDVYRKEQLSLAPDLKPIIESLTEQQIFWVRKTIGGREKDKIRYCRKHGIPYEKLLEWTEFYKDNRYEEYKEKAKIVRMNNEMKIEKLKNKNKEQAEKLKRLERENKMLEKERNSALALLELKKSTTN